MSQDDYYVPMLGFLVMLVTSIIIHIAPQLLKFMSMMYCAYVNVLKCYEFRPVFSNNNNESVFAI